MAQRNTGESMDFYPDSQSPTYCTRNQRYLESVLFAIIVATIEEDYYTEEKDIMSLLTGSNLTQI
jgi:hypothetical protein